VLALLVLAPRGVPARRLLPARACHEACMSAVDTCVADTGWRRRRCRRKLAALSAKCRRRGLAVCTDAYPPPTTTTVTTTTSTTTAPSLSAPQAIALTGCASSGYTAPVTIGAQRFDLVTDSGSTTVAVASTTCPAADCGSLSPLYGPGGTAVDLGRTASALYGDGSTWSGSVFSDLVSPAGSTAAVRMAFAAIDAEQGFFVPAACNFVDVLDASQGIFGLGGTALAVAGTDSYLDTLARESALGDTFAVRVCDSGGTLWLGGYDAAAAAAVPTYTPMVAGTPYYAVTLADVRIGGSTLGFDASAFGATLVDIGTTALVLPPAAFAALANAVAAQPVFAQNFGGASWFTGGFCYTPAQGLTKAELDAALPMLTLAFPSPAGTTFTVDLPATESYLLQQNDTSGTAYYCPGIEQAEGIPTILGANALHTLLVVVDRVRRQVGFAPSEGCAPLSTTVRVPATGPAPSARPAPPYRRPRRE